MPLPRHHAVARTLLLLAASVGCTGPQRTFEEAAHAWEARKAYQATAVAPMTAEVSRHYERGWRRGYTTVRLGRDCCPPPVPPHAYLGKKYQCPSGQRLVQLWYHGFAEGVAAGRACGFGPRVVINEVDCRQGCQAACHSPVGGVLPDPRVAMAGQYTPRLELEAAPAMFAPVHAIGSVTTAPAAVSPVGEQREAVTAEPAEGEDKEPAAEADDLDYTPSETTPIVFPEQKQAKPTDRSDKLEAEPLPYGSP